MVHRLTKSQIRLKQRSTHVRKMTINKAVLFPGCPIS